MQEFQLKIIPSKDNQFNIELYQCAYKKAGEKKRSSAKKISKLNYSKIVLIKTAIYKALKENKYDNQSLSHRRKTPYILTEETGTWLAILFKTIQPLRKETKIFNICHEIMAMSNEEAHYWFAKINNSPSLALKALRILLGEEENK